MFIDARKIGSEKDMPTSVCIIGGGVAGITLALEFQKQNIPVCLVESGGFKPDNQTRDLYRGENAGLPYIFSDGCRSRYFGGSSNCWGGWCAPLDPIDFEKRSWVNESGWPFGIEELTPYYNRSHEILKLGPFSYNSSFWLDKINHKEVKRIITDNNSLLADKISQFSAPVRMGEAYKAELEKSKNIQVYLHANVTKIETDIEGQVIQRVSVTTFHGNNFFITARLFVLAAGGIENARLLLASNEVHTDGLGNKNDLVGRYFMDHPRVYTGNISFAEGWQSNRLYDIKYNDHSPVVFANGTHIASQLSLSPKVQEKEKLLNARVSFSSVFPGEGTAGAMALWRLKQAAKKKANPEEKIMSDILQVLTNTKDVMGYSFTRFARPRFLVKSTQFQVITEQEPNERSRILLSDKKDALGMPRVKVDWKIGDNEHRTIEKTVKIVSGELLKMGIAKNIQIQPTEAGLTENMEGTWHHMGTTRMHTSPKKGVTDANCKVHGIENLFIAGSSLFPTGGANFPTITLTALAIRLADHLKNELSKTSVANYVIERQIPLVK